ncbi:hypothetical protein DFJ77DRAFT_442336 [Powellomyces hirtus]|nr:hypothetical protein DFJ77DRAFT_442336 [Powellomyces hirtus]
MEPLPAATQLKNVLALFPTLPATDRNAFLDGLLRQCCPSDLAQVAATCQTLSTEGSQGLDFLTILPAETVMKILEYLSWEDLLRMEQVSVGWAKFADDSLIWQKHYAALYAKHYYLPDVPQNVSQNPKVDVVVFMKEVYAWYKYASAPQCVRAHSGRIVAMELKGDILITCGQDRLIKAWDVATMTVTSTLESSIAVSVDFLPNDRASEAVMPGLLAVAHYDGSIEIWDWPTRTHRVTTTRFHMPVSKLLLLEDYVYASAAMSIGLWSVETGVLLDVYTLQRQFSGPASTHTGFKIAILQKCAGHLLAITSEGQREYFLLHRDTLVADSLPEVSTWRTQLSGDTLNCTSGSIATPSFCNPDATSGWVVDLDLSERLINDIRLHLRKGFANWEIYGKHYIAFLVDTGQAYKLSVELVMPWKGGKSLKIGFPFARLLGTPLLKMGHNCIVAAASSDVYYVRFGRDKIKWRNAA